MAVPRNRSSRNRKGNRRSHHFVEPKAFTQCPNCRNMMQPFHVCGSCGQYKGRSYRTQEASA